jgi:hypothetical protein
LSGNGAEQLVEHIGEERFDDPRLTIANRHELGPVVGDLDRRLCGPCRALRFEDRSQANHVEVWGKTFGRGATTAGHPVTMIPRSP